MHKQKGVTFVGMVVVAILVVLVAVLGLRLLPAYMEYYTVKNTMKQIAYDPELKGATASQVKRAFDRHAAIDNITVVGPEDLDISIEGGQVSVGVEYVKKVPLFGNVSFCIDFAAKSGG